MPQGMLMEAKQISELTGIDLGNRYFLVIAENDDELLEKETVLTQQLEAQNIPYRALSQWLMSTNQQQQFIQQFTAAVQPQDYAVLQDIGIPPETIQTALLALGTETPISLSSALQQQIGQAWQTLYLGYLLPGKVAGIVQIVGQSAFPLKIWPISKISFGRINDRI